MNKDLLTNALGKVESLATGDVSSLSVEEAGMLQLYVQSRAAVEGELAENEAALCQRIRACIGRWQEVETLPVLSKEEQRQPFLRGILAKLSAKRFDAVSDGEARFIEATLEVVSGRPETDIVNHRLAAMITQLLSARRAAAAPSPEPEQGVTAEFDDGVRIEATGASDAPAQRLDAHDVFTEKRRTRVSGLDGLDADLMASVYEVEGETEIDGDVPDQALLVVRGGSLTVNGFVGGSIVAADDITINGNLSTNWVVSSAGNIRSRAALAHSRVVAKRGRIDIERAEAPACVFAWDGLRIAGDVTGGKLLGRTIEVEGRVMGAELHATDAITANIFQAPPSGNTVLCLRKSISCEDYGQSLPADDRKRYRSIGKHQYDTTVTRQLIHHATRDVEDGYRVILYYLLGGVADAQGVRVMRGLQCQIGAWSEMGEAAESLIRLFENTKRAGRPLRPDDATRTAQQCIQGLEHVVDAIKSASSAFEVPRKGTIIKVAGELSGLATRIVRGEVSTADFDRVIGEVRRRREICAHAQKGLDEAQAQQVASLNMKTEVIEHIETQSEKLDSMVGQVTAELRKNPSQAMRQRATSSVVRLIQASIDRNHQNVRTWQSALGTSQEEIEAVYTALGDNAAFLFSGENTGPPYVEAKHFGEGVIIAANPADGSDPLDTAAPILVFDTASNAPSRYGLSEGQIKKLEID